MHNQKYTHLSQFERDRIEALLNGNHKQKDIAFILGRDKSTISREIKKYKLKRSRKWTPNKEGYDSELAQLKAKVKRSNAKYQGKKINENKELREYIIEKLRAGWSPDDISGRLREERKPFYASKNLIYEWLYSIWGQRHCPLLYSRQYRPRKRKKKKTKKVLIPNRIGIEMRPLGATNTTRYGHYESDSIVSGKKTGSKTGLSVMREKKSKYMKIKKIRSLEPDVTNRALSQMSVNLIVKTFTMDNGIENQRYEALGIPTYFCDPYSSWQKGGVEHGNKMIRRYIPKGVDISLFSDDYVSMVEEILNNKPRKSLGYKTPLEVMEENNLLI